MPGAHTGLRPPQQRRSRESLERILRAGADVLADRGYDGFTIGEVSRKAKVSVGSVYGRFESKDAPLLGHKQSFDPDQLNVRLAPKADIRR